MDEDSSAKFIGSLTKFLQSLCNGYVEFQKGVELVGHIYLSIDTGEKVDYILHERVSKNDENSVSFVSNSFHAQPTDKKDKTGKEGARCKDGGRGSEQASDDDDDDDDIMIVDQSERIPGSTNTGTMPNRTLKRPAGSDSRLAQHSALQPHRNRGNGSPAASQSKYRQSYGGPSATVTNQNVQQDNINIGDVKLEQLSADDLLSLASQVEEGASSSHASSDTGPQAHIKQGSPTLDSSAGQPVWIKQEAPDGSQGGHDTGLRFKLLEPKKEKSLASERSRMWCEKIKLDPKRYEEQKKKDSERNRMNRRKPKSEERARQREATRLRMQKTRAKRKAERVAEARNGQPSTRAVSKKSVTRTVAATNDAALAAKRKKAAESKRRERANWTEQKWRSHREKNLAAYYARKARKASNNMQGWPRSHDGQSDSSNSGSDLYPVMMHQNPAYSSNPVFPGFTSMSGQSSSSGSRHHSQSLPGMSGAANPYASPGTSQSMGGIDPAADAMMMQRKMTPHCLSAPASSFGTMSRNTYYSRIYRQRLKEDPVRYKDYLEKQLVHVRRYKAKKKLSKDMLSNLV